MTLSSLSSDENHAAPAVQSDVVPSPFFSVAESSTFMFGASAEVCPAIVTDAAGVGAGAGVDEPPAQPADTASATAAEETTVREVPYTFYL